MSARPTALFCGDLDDIEFIQEVERAFDIELTDEEKASLRTLGDVVALVESKREATPRGPCANALAHQAISRVAGRRIAPRNRADELPSVDDLANSLSRGERLRLPSEDYTGRIADLGGWLVLLGFLAFVAAAFGAVLGELGDAPANWIPFALFGGIGLAVLGYLIMGYAPSSYRDRTVGEVARDVAAFNRAVLVRRGAAERSGDVLATLRHLAARASGIEIERIQPNSPLNP